MKLSYDRPCFDSLSLENIDKAVELMDRFCVDNLVGSRQRHRLRTALKDTLLGYQLQDEREPFELLFVRARNTITIYLGVRSASNNVLGGPTFAPGVLDQLDPQPTWRFQHGRNIVTFSLTLPRTSGVTTLKMLMRYMDSERLTFRKGVALRLLNMMVLILEPWLTAKIIEGLSAGDMGMILTLASLFLVTQLASSLFTFFGSCYLQRAYHAMITELRFDLTECLPRVKTEHIDTNGTGAFTERVIGEAYNVANGINNLVLVFTDLFRLASLLIAFATVSPLVMGYELLLYVVYFVIVRMQSKKQVEDSRRVNAAAEDFTGLVTETVRASRDIKLLHCEESFQAAAKDVIGRLSEQSLTRRIRVTKHELARSQFVSWTDYIFMGILILLIAQYGMLPATALILYTYNGKLYDIARRISGAHDDYCALLLSAERINQLIDSDDFAQERFGQRHLEQVRGALEFRDVSFSYTQEDGDPVPVLKGMDLRIPAGQSVALVGRNGCGKSTALSLMARLYEPTGGSIALDGVDLSELDRDTIRNNVGVVSQSPYLFNMSVRDNFALVKSGVTDEEIVRVCKLACVHDDIMRLSEGYDTVVGEGGCLLSGGQRQRIALARAFLKDYPVIMLDEATSALDNETQSSICETIRDMRGHKTVVMIAHRLSIVSDFDQIAYLQDGKVLAAGTHEEMLANCPEYRKLYAEDAR